MASPKGLAAMAWVALLLECAIAATITVGAPSGGWDLSTDLSAWAASQTFSVGDTLVFQYGSTHDVLEVTKANYDACQKSSPIGTYNNGNTSSPCPLPAALSLICGVPDHCSSGMKLEVDVSGASPPSTSRRRLLRPFRLLPHFRIAAYDKFTGPPTTPGHPSPPTMRSSPPPPNSAPVGLKAPATATAGVLFWLLMLLAI
ncbi:unnamed protein product [Spirodela intermedia]|uniref:Phytocyanin domain-containing protein n=1 Tax=Spirodela intermedia TaxID=51605 RepID=A0A7I8ILB5_SPIIN|nr:unnamed protein product [Spirodela intermedia]CAA6658317.1 unnamed protein product [Spirodela intermedia]